MANSEQSSVTLTAGSNLSAVVVEWLRNELDDPDIVDSDNFLDIGGHSLTFVRMNRFLHEVHGVGLDMQDVYDKSLSEAAASAQVVGPPVPTPSIHNESAEK